MSDKLLFERFIIALLASKLDKKSMKKIELGKRTVSAEKGCFCNIKPLLSAENREIIDVLRQNPFFYGFFRGHDLFGGAFEIPFDVIDEWALLCERFPQGDNCYVDKKGKIHQQNANGMRGERV